MRSACVRLAMACMAICIDTGMSSARAADRLSFCADCQVQLGVGGTYHFWGRTGGVVIPLTVLWDRDRWEGGAFRMAGSQQFYDSTFGARVRVADPYWSFSASRRWEFFRRPHWRLLIGFGGSY